MLLRSNSLPSWFVGLLLLLLLWGSEAHTSREKELNCQKNKPNNKSRRSIGVVLDSGSEIGKQQMVAMKMALRRFHLSSCVTLELLLHDSHPNFTFPSSSGIVAVIVGSVGIKELIFISDHKIPVGIPVVSTSVQQLQPHPIPSLIQMANNTTHRMQCISSILTHFQWPRKATVFYDLNSSVESVHRLFHSFRSANIEIQHLLPLSSSSNQAEVLIEKELKKLMNSQRNGVFIVTQLSLELVALLFTEAKKLNMVGNGYGWIVSDDVFDLIDSSLDSSSLLRKMEGVTGFRTHLDDTKKSFQSFETKLKKMYGLEYPEDDEPTKVSIFAARAYDATWAITRAIESLDEKFSSSQLMEKISKSNFKNGMLISQAPSFQIIKVADQSCKEVAFWTPKIGFAESVEVEIKANNIGRNVAVGDLSRRLMTRDNSRGEKRLKFAVPGKGACQELVKVSDHMNGNYINGFSIDVFKEVMANINYMPYSSHYDLYPLNVTYDEIIQAVSNQTYDGAVGDITILAHRFDSVDFTVAYLEADIVMVVTEKEDKWKRFWVFMEVFDVTLWLLILTMHLFISSVVWVIEREKNEQLKGFGSMLWFSVSIIFYMQREPVKKGLARLVLGPWLFGILVLTASFSASLTSMMVISWSQPSIPDVETLKEMDATVGCNTESFICSYLNDTLNFEKARIKTINSLNDYPAAFQNGSIKAAFFISPHAEVFLAKNCKGFTKGVSSHKLGGIGFAFPKGSPLTAMVSASIVELTETIDMPQMEHLLDSFKCSAKSNGLGLGLGPFVGLFLICGSIALLVLLYMGLQFITTKLAQALELLYYIPFYYNS